MSEATFLAIVYGALFVLMRVPLGTRGAVAGGALSGAAFWVRPEAALVALAAGVVTGVTQGRRQALALLVAATVVEARMPGSCAGSAACGCPRPSLRRKSKETVASSTSGSCPARRRLRAMRSPRVRTCPASR